MKGRDELRQENEALGDRIFRLSAAILRISVSLDVSTVLQEVFERACRLCQFAPYLSASMSSYSVGDSVSGQS